MKKKATTYTEDDIKVLDDREHVRARLPIYAGNKNPSLYSIPVFAAGSLEVQTVTFIPAVLKCIGEILDNCVDELTQLENVKSKEITIIAKPEEGTYSISDNGRGVPIGKHESGQFTPEVVFGSLRSGRNFSDGRKSGVIGMNGMGSSITNFCSSVFKVKIIRDGKIYTQEFSDGAAFIEQPHIRSTTVKKTGTEITFTLDREVFGDVRLPEELIRSKAMSIALTNPDIKVIYSTGNSITSFKYPNGLYDVVKTLGNVFEFKAARLGLSFQFHIIPNFSNATDETIFSWVNSSLLFDGGSCNTQFVNAFTDKVISHLESAAKKQKCEISKADVKQGLLILGDIKITDPQFDAQAKTRFVGPSIRKEIQECIDVLWSSFARRHKDWLEQVLKHAHDRYHSSANKKAIKEHQKFSAKKVPGLVDAVSRNRNRCSLLITEGLSAASSITEARDPNTIASFPLTGKINNVYGTTIAQLLKMGKVTGLLTAVGLTPGKSFARSDLRFGKIVIATDADYDGSDICTLLVNLFYQFWPELFDSDYQPFIYRLITPNICLVKGKRRVYFPTRHEYEACKTKYKGWDVRYYKGLGSMQRADWDILLSEMDKYLVPIIDDGDMTDTLELLFGPSSIKRKEWLQTTGV